jgi:DNA-binding response OmpR family regulator
MRILCVEDDADSRQIMSILLERAGYEVVLAKSTTDGLRLAEKDGFDLIILDNWFEKGSGIELCKQIRGFDTDTPILFFTSAAFKSDFKEAMDAGAQGYLVKPGGIEVLIETIEGLTHPTNGRSTVVRRRIMDALNEEDIVALDKPIEAKV